MTIAGTRNASYLVFANVKPNLAVETATFREGMKLFCLGVSHRKCISKARERLERKQVALPKNLPEAVQEEIPQTPELN